MSAAGPRRCPTGGSTGCCTASPSPRSARRGRWPTSRAGCSATASTPRTRAGRSSSPRCRAPAPRCCWRRWRGCRSSAPRPTATCRSPCCRCSGATRPAGSASEPHGPSARTATGSRSASTAPRRSRRCCGWPSGRSHYRAGRHRALAGGRRRARVRGLLPPPHGQGGGGGRRRRARYLSKNNANIARLGLIERLFPDATVVVPVRDPLGAERRRCSASTCASCDLHAREPFARRYMEGTRPFRVRRGAEADRLRRRVPDRRRPPTSRPSGCATGRTPTRRCWRPPGDRVVFVDLDALSAAPDRHLPPLAEALGLADPDALAAAAARFRPQPPVDPPEAPAALMARAAAIHDALRRRCLSPAPPPADVASAR